MLSIAALVAWAIRMSFARYASCGSIPWASPSPDSPRIVLAPRLRSLSPAIQFFHGSRHRSTGSGFVQGSMRSAGAAADTTRTTGGAETSSTNLMSATLVVAPRQPSVSMVCACRHARAIEKAHRNRHQSGKTIVREPRSRRVPNTPAGPNRDLAGGESFTTPRATRRASKLKG